MRNGPDIAVGGLDEGDVVDGRMPITINAYGSERADVPTGSVTPRVFPAWWARSSPSSLLAYHPVLARPYRNMDNPAVTQHIQDREHIVLLVDTFTIRSA
ncbi:MAG: hypothetical protein R2811_09710 [Flavobacteriales bacterium]